MYTKKEQRPKQISEKRFFEIKRFSYTLTGVRNINDTAETRIPSD